MKYVVIGILIIVSLPLIFSVLSFTFPFIIIGFILTCLFSKSREVSSDKNVIEKTKPTSKPENIKVNNELTKETITTKVAGVTFNNRQSHIQKLQVGDPLILRRERDNKYDENAIAIYDIKENQIGYIPKDLAVKLVDILDSDRRYDCTINKITGGRHLNYGLVINISFHKDIYFNGYTLKVKRDKKNKENINYNFFEFINDIDNISLRNFIKLKYEDIKKSNSFDNVSLGSSGGIEFTALLLLYEYSKIRKDIIAVQGCIEGIKLAFLGISPMIFNSFVKIIVEEHANINYKEWKDICSYLNENHREWIKIIEFSNEYDFDDFNRFQKHTHLSNILVIELKDTITQRNLQSSMRFVNIGASNKRTGNFELSEYYYFRAIHEDYINPEAYYALGKLYYLLKEYDKSISMYLACMHLQISLLENKHDEYRSCVNTELVYSSLSENIKSILPTKSSAIIFESPLLSRHLGHSLIDKTDNDEFKIAYQLSISNDKNQHIKYLSRKGISIKDYEDINQKKYIPHATNFLLKNIIWNEIGNYNVIDIYKLESVLLNK